MNSNSARRIYALAMVAMTALGIGVLCSPAQAQTQTQPQLYVAVISKGFQHQFWQTVKAGAEQAGRDLHVKVTFEGPESETMIDKQIDMLAATLSKKPGAIGFAALDSKAAIPLLRKAKAANIPVIAFDAGVDSDIPVATASTDNRAAASLAADKMAELIGGKGEVAVVAHDQTSRTGTDRRDGFVERIKSQYPQIRIVSVQYGADLLSATEVAKSILQANPRLSGLFGTNEGTAIGIVNGVKESKRKVVIVGFDSGKQQKDAIRAGLIAGSITQNPLGMGYKTVEAAVKAIKGQPLPKLIDTGFYWYDKTTIADPKIAPLLYD